MEGSMGSSAGGNLGAALHPALQPAEPQRCSAAGVAAARGQAQQGRRTGAALKAERRQHARGIARRKPEAVARALRLMGRGVGWAGWSEQVDTQ